MANSLLGVASHRDQPRCVLPIPGRLALAGLRLCVGIWATSLSLGTAHAQASELDRDCTYVEQVRLGSDARLVYDAAEKCLAHFKGDDASQVRVRTLLARASAAELLFVQTEIGYYLDESVRAYRRASDLSRATALAEEYSFVLERLAVLDRTWRRSRAQAMRSIRRGEEPYASDVMPEQAFIRRKIRTWRVWGTIEAVAAAGAFALVLGNWSDTFGANTENSGEPWIGAFLGGFGLAAGGALGTLSAVHFTRASRAARFQATPTVHVNFQRVGIARGTYALPTGLSLRWRI